MTNQHIALIYTGGTIGMEKTSQGYAPMRDFSTVLSTFLQNGIDVLPRYTFHAYASPIDSTNATPQDWQVIGRDIAARYADYDGFVVLHGTDTMAYTASALSFMLQGLRKPVILTGSQIPLKETRSDALQNLVTALQLAASDAINEVAIYFHQRLLRGNRSTKISAERFSAFDSPNYPWLARVGIEVNWNTAALLPRAEKENFQLPDYGHARILSMRFVPGMHCNTLDAILALSPHALIIEAYGAGNLPDNDPTWIKMLEDANAKGVVLVVCSQSSHGRVDMNSYATNSSFKRAGLIGTSDMTFEAIYTKLHHLFALNLSVSKIKAELRRSISGDLSLRCDTA